MTDYGDSPAFVIRELTGQKRTLRLVGRGLPYRPLSLDTRQRVEVDWLPGAPHGTATILGPIDNPTTINGAWKQRFVIEPLSGTLVTSPTAPITLDGKAFGDIVDIDVVVDSMCREGQLCEVSWGPVVRHGFLENWVRKWTTVKDLEWQMNFKWISRGEKVDPVVFVTTAGFDGIAGGMQSLLDGLDAIEVPPELGVSTSLVEGLQAFQQSIEDSIGSVTDSVQQFTAQVTGVIRTVRGIAATFDGLGTDAEDLVSFIEAQFGSELGLDAGPGAPGTGGFFLGVPYPQQNEAQKRISLVLVDDIKRWALRVKHHCALQKAKLKVALGGNVVAQVTVKSGQDLKDLAKQYYGSPFEWRRIMQFNELTGIDPPEGTLVFIPKTNPQEAGQGCPDV